MTEMEKAVADQAAATHADHVAEHQAMVRAKLAEDAGTTAPHPTHAIPCPCCGTQAVAGATCASCGTTVA